MDYLVALAKNDVVKKALKTIGGPNLPPVLERAEEPWADDELKGMEVGVAGGKDAKFGKEITATIEAAGGEVVGGFEQTTYPVDTKFDALVLDVSGASSAEDLRGLYDAFNPTLKKVRPNGRIVVVSDYGEVDDPGESMAWHATEAFVRSMAKELGRFGTTANLLRVTDGAADRIEGPLRFFLSKRSCYITGQPLTLTNDAAASDGEWTRPLYGKVALVTGAARGIGKATARALAREGATVVIVDVESAEELANEVAQEINGHAVMGDITIPKEREEISQFLADLGGVDIVIHNAGITRDKLLVNMDASRWDSVIGVNLEGAHDLHERLAEDEVLNDGGRVLFLASVAGIGGNAGQTAYAATKYGVYGLARALSKKFNERGITFNAVAPGFIETRMTDEIPFAIREVGRRLSALSQGGQPEDVAETLTFLSTPQASGVNGEILRICGGALIGQ